MPPGTNLPDVPGMWEYKAIHVENDGLVSERLEAILGPLGKDGWEVASAVQRSTHGYSHGATFVLKRPARERG